MADSESRTSSRGLYVPGLLWAMIFGIVAAIGLTGQFEWLFHSGTKWIVAGAIAFIGLIMLLTALPTRSRNR